MEHDHDFSALQDLLALQKRELPADTEVNRFLIEFHRRQRVQLLAPESGWARVISWMKGRAENFRLIPSLSYASGFAALAVLTFVSFSQQVQVTQSGGGYTLSLRMPTSQGAFAMVPASFGRGAATDSMTFTPSSATTGATHFILANSRVAYDANVAF